MGKRSSKDTKKKLEEKLGQKGRERLENATDLVGELLDEVVPPGSSFEDYEREALNIANEIVRRKLEQKLQRIADGHAEMLHIEHNDDWHGIGAGFYEKKEFRRHLPGTVSYHSLVGSLVVRRFTYRECVRNGATYVPLELEAGLMERMTPGFAQCVALAFSQVPIREAERLLLAAGRAPPSRATLDRGAKDLGAYAIACNDEIEPVVRSQETLPAGTVAVALGLDRTAVAMRNADGHFFMGSDIRRPRPKGARQSKGKGVQWRMDYVATVTFLDASGERLDSRHYRLRHDAEPEMVADRMLADVRRALQQSPKLKLILVQDGAPELWILMRRKLRSEGLVKKWEEVLDWYHVDERLSACLDLADLAQPLRIEQRSRWREMLLKRSKGEKFFMRSLRAFNDKIRADEKEKFAEHLGYFARRKKLLGYARIRRKKLPIGSGATEGACKSLVGTRAKRSGQHWTQRGLSAAVHLRSLDQSGRFESFWELFSERYKATVMFPILIRA